MEVGLEGYTTRVVLLREQTFISPIETVSRHTGDTQWPHSLPDLVGLEQTKCATSVGDPALFGAVRLEVDKNVNKQWD